MPGYKSNSDDSITVTLSKNPHHNATRGALNRWRYRKFGSTTGGVMANVSAKDILELAEEMFDVAAVPQATRDKYYSEFNKKYHTSFKP